MIQNPDILIVGGGTSGMCAALEASDAGASVLVIEGTERLGGTLHLSSGQMSAAGTRIQAARGIHDTPDMHFAEVMRLSRGTADAALVRIAVDEAPHTLHWLLDNGLELLPNMPTTNWGHEPYETERTYWGPEAGRSVLKVVLPLFERAVASGRVTLRLSTKVSRLTTDARGAVTGAALESGETVAAGVVVLATGTYANDRAMHERLTGRPYYGWAYEGSVGAGIRMAEALGAEIAHGEKFLPTFAGVYDPRIDMIGGMTDTTPQRRLPWEVYLTSEGKRFVAEDHPSVDARERALLDAPDMSFWAVFDAGIYRDAPSFFPNADQAMLEGFWNRYPDYVKAVSLEELAAKTGMPLTALTRTLDEYRSAVKTGVDKFGRRHLPRALAEPPFYAVRHRGLSVVGFAGLAVDPDMRVKRAGGGVIENLYAIGEVQGLGTLSGNAFVGGMSLTPAMGFGRRLGRQLGESARQRRVA